MSRATGRKNGRPASRRNPASFGTAERLPSGRWRASYRRDGAKFTAPETFETKDDAEQWLAGERTDRARGTWADPRQGRIEFAEYANDWLASRVDIAPTTAHLYRHILDRWVLPRMGGARGVELGTHTLAEVTAPVVRRWYALVYATSRAELIEARTRPLGRAPHPVRRWAQATGRPVGDSGRLAPALIAEWEAAGSPEMPDTRPRRSIDENTVTDDLGRSQAAAAYRLMRAIMFTAAREGLIQHNPCQIVGGGAVHTEERPIATPDEVAQLAALMPRRWAAAVSVAAWSGLRYGELFALARRHVNLDAGTVRVERSLRFVPGDPNRFGKPKTRSSNRTVHLPEFVIEQLRAHLDEFTEPDPEALVFTTINGSPVANRRLNDAFVKARTALGRTELRWHDLRHTGATLAYSAGASVREVQNRLGHTTMRAAQIYAHVADDSDRLLAERLNAQFAHADKPMLKAV